MISDSTNELPLIDPDHCFLCGSYIPPFNIRPLMVSEDGKGLLSFCEQCQPEENDDN